MAAAPGSPFSLHTYHASAILPNLPRPSKLQLYLIRGRLKAKSLLCPSPDPRRAEDLLSFVFQSAPSGKGSLEGKADLWSLQVTLATFAFCMLLPLGFYQQ